MRHSQKCEDFKVETLKTPPVIHQYLGAYEQMDVDAISTLLSDDVSFLNIQHGEATHAAKGIVEWRNLAESSLPAFSKRRITPQQIDSAGQYWVVRAHFEAILSKSDHDNFASGADISTDVLILLHLHHNKIAGIIDIT